MKSKRLFNFIMAIIMVFSFCTALSVKIFVPLQVSAAYENTHTNTGNQRADIVAIAQTQVGYHEGSLEGTTNGSDNFTKYNKELYAIGGSYKYMWCQSFIAWCAIKADVPSSVIKRTAGTVDAMDFFKAQGVWQGRSYTPQSGDIIYFTSSSSNSGYHVGIVESVSGSTINTIEGNYSNKVARHSVTVGSSSIVGYGVPNYHVPDPDPPKWYDNVTPVNIGDDFYAQIKCEDNGCYLSNIDGNVSGAGSIATKNQTWHFVRQSDESYAILSYYDNLSMDVYAASTDNATNIQMMPYVGNTAQKFWIYSINGAYYFRPQCTEYPFTINRQNNDNLEVWYFDPTFTNKRFDIIKMDLDGNMPISIGGDFYAHIVCEDGGCYLSNIEGNVGGANPIGTKNQIWHFKWLNDGSYSITSYYDGLSMDVADAKTDNATNIQMMPYIGNTAQKFWLYSINGAYYLRSQCNVYPFTINRQNNDNLELWYYDPTFSNKRFNIIKMDCGGNLPINVEGNFNGDFYGKIKSNVNGKYLTNINSNVECADDNDRNNQIWHFQWQHDGSYSITSYEDERSMDIYCAKQENGTNVQMMPYVANTAQRFWIYYMNDAYYIQPLCTALPFTINGDNLEIWIYDKTFENKKFDIIEVIPKSKVEGDCNNDGELTVADAILLQKWLLAESDTILPNWKAADLYENDRLDILDLCLLKQKLIS